ncbi:putative amine oxidase [copper-containing] [Watersipora subatra]|uniref:putative amine oxidase [copper-containing] n=1 Tax=Watersipora subatra TaxID=2589382 RepID=UPI00355C58E9
MAVKKSNRKWIAAVVVLALLALIFLILTIVFAVRNKKIVGSSKYDDVKAQTAKNKRANEVFADLTKAQYKAVLKYIKKETDFNVVDSDDAKISDNYVYSIEALVPPKADVLEYLDTGADVELVYKAKVTLYMGAEEPKSVKEVIVYPVDNPTMMENFVNPGNRVHTWQSRALCPNVETTLLVETLYDILAPLNPMLKGQFGLSFERNCDVATTCLFPLGVPKVVPGETDRTILMALWYPPGIIDYYLWPIPMTVIVYTPGNGNNFVLRKVIFDNVEYDSIDALVEAYDSGNLRDFSSHAQTAKEEGMGSPYRRGTDVNPDELPPPVQEAVVKRFNVDGHHVEWLGWQFDMTFSPKTAAQLYNIGFNGNRIAYQLGIQDIMVKYTGPVPNVAFRNYMDVSWNLGLTSTTLTKGYDCPESAEYISATVFNNGFGEAIEQENIACVFEYRNHAPLRRHYSYYRFTMSMNDIVLVFRQIATVFNYDYVIDMEIHQTGVITYSILPTGYIQTFLPAGGDGIKYGYDLLPDVGNTGIFHTHLFDVKVDLDIGGASSNRFMTVDMEAESRPHPLNSSVILSYAVLKQSMKSTEQEAIINYDFTKPKEYVVYNENELNSRNNQPIGYRIQSSSFVYPIVPASDPLSNLASWIHHQIAVTKYKEDELTTVTYTAQADPYDPLISLKYFQEDNESIVDEDLVCWVTLGVNHVPTAEDIPVTTTAGKKMSLDLIPHNYYKEDISMASRDAFLKSNFDE